MTNGGDYLALETSAGVIVDNTAWSGKNGFSPEGASRTLDPAYLDARTTTRLTSARRRP